eukprot:GHVS01090087.1.p1 GENE.GHVS01090087.1~~GHVS01090087.1.p1  ORF type:complete len:387 (-),score=76.67 GHVS01090087.1:784-1785(-)
MCLPYYLFDAAAVEWLCYEDDHGAVETVLRPECNSRQLLCLPINDTSETQTPNAGSHLALLLCFLQIRTCRSCTSTSASSSTNCGYGSSNNGRCDGTTGMGRDRARLPAVSFLLCDSSPNTIYPPGCSVSATMRNRPNESSSSVILRKATKLAYMISALAPWQVHASAQQDHEQDQSELHTQQPNQRVEEMGPSAGNKLPTSERSDVMESVIRICERCSKQSNCVDCGMFVLAYVDVAIRWLLELQQLQQLLPKGQQEEQKLQTLQGTAGTTRISEKQPQQLQGHKPTVGSVVFCLSSLGALEERLAQIEDSDIRKMRLYVYATVARAAGIQR